jgi:hypothetical protein
MFSIATVANSKRSTKLRFAIGALIRVSVLSFVAVTARREQAVQGCAASSNIPGIIPM